MHSSVTQLPAPQSPLVASFESLVREHLMSLLQSPLFDASSRSREFLTFIVEETLCGRGEKLNQAVIAAAVFHRKGDFDAILDPVVRVQAGRLRRSLERFYLLSTNTDLRIEIPKGTYSPVFADASAKNSVNAEILSDLHITTATLSELTPDWPTIVIHSFDTHAAGIEIAAALKDQLAMELNRYGGLHVARSHDVERFDSHQQGSLRFELRGAVRKMPDGYLVGARVVDRATGEQVWSDEYLTGAKASRWSREIDDVVRAIAAHIGAEHGVVMRLLARERCSQTNMTGAFSTLLRANHFFLSRQVSELVPTIKSLEQLVICEPEVSAGWSYLARLYLANYTFELSDAQTSIEKAIGYAYQGVALDPTSIRGRCVLAKALLVKGEVESAREELEQTLRLSPNSLAYREMIGWLLALTGDWSRGMELIHDAVERNPFCLPYVKHGLWADHLRSGEFDKAYIAALEYCGSTFFWRELMSATCLGHLGRVNEADASVMALLHEKPDFAQRGRTLIGYYIKSVDLRERIVEGLDKAGLILT